MARSTSSVQPFEDDAVKEAIEGHPPAVRDRLFELRALILEAAAGTDGIGDLTETLKWGQPSYLPSKPRVGSTVRMGGLKDDPDRCALFFHCQSNLIETFRELYPDELDFQGNRAIVLPVSGKLPTDALKHCVSLCLTYHLRSLGRR